MQKIVQSKSKTNPSLILSSDEHIREDVPIARIDKFFETMSGKVLFLKELQKKYDIPIISGGDILDKARVSPLLETWCMDNLPRIVTIPSNHDTVNKNLYMVRKSSIAVLHKSENIKILMDEKYSENSNIKTCDHCNLDYNIELYGFPWLIEPKDIKIEKNKKRRVAIAHYLVYENKNIFPELIATKAISLLKRLKSFDLIITGHNHLSFVVEYKGRLLVNPGSMMRMFANQTDHRPRIYLYYAENNIVKPIYYPIEPSEKVLSRQHIEIKKEKDNRMNAFIARAKDDEEISISFEKNAESYFSINSTTKSIKEFVWECIND